MFEKGKEYIIQSIKEPRISGQLFIIFDQEDNRWNCEARLRIPDQIHSSFSKFQFWNLLADLWETTEGYIKFCPNGKPKGPTFDEWISPNECARVLNMRDIAIKYVDNLDIIERLYGKNQLASS